MEDGWIRADARPDGSIPVIAGQFDLADAIVAPEEWSAIQEATGNNSKIAEGEEYYPGAYFDQTLVQGQVEDVLWALRSGRRQQAGRLLEVGCGPGFLLARLRDTLPGWEVTGVDPSSASCAQARARGLDVREGLLDSADLATGFDAFVVMGNFQLHRDPADTLRRLAALATPGAELYLDLKNPRTTARRLGRALVAVPLARDAGAVHAFAAHAFHGMRHGIPKAAVHALLTDTGWTVDEMRTVGPRLLRFGNAHGFSQGAKGLVWRGLDAIDGLADERAWIQVAAHRS